MIQIANKLDDGKPIKIDFPKLVNGRTFICQ